MSRTARRRTSRLHLSLTGWALTLFALYITARAWPVQTAVIAAVLALTGIAAAVGLRRLDPRGRRRLRVTLPRPRRATSRSLAAYRAMSPDDFEHAIARLARRAPGVRSAIAQGGSNDRGLDVLVHLRDGRRILIQCKRYGPPKNVTSEDVQKTNGTYRDIHHCALAVIVTTSSYTRDAVETNVLLARPLVLVDGPALADWAAGGRPPWETVRAPR
ncbi:restriction endonuclease [Streptomyces sp. NPDC021098]|uniref:restriction endonuclease n=1 Tax=unclassified Streptomyces TaxID=2593676 RepID=UPI0037B758D1